MRLGRDGSRGSSASRRASFFCHSASACRSCRSCPSAQDSIRRLSWSSWRGERGAGDPRHNRPARDAAAGAKTGRAAKAGLRAGPRLFRRRRSYIGLLPLLGFRIARALFVAVFQPALERPTTLRQWATQLTIAVGTAAVTYFVFERYLSVMLPRGRWTGW